MLNLEWRLEGSHDCSHRQFSEVSFEIDSANFCTDLPRILSIVSLLACEDVWSSLQVCNSTVCLGLGCRLYMCL